MSILNSEDVLYLHSRMIDITGGAKGIRDAGALESAIYHAYASFDRRDLYPTIEEKAARQAYALVRNHPFIDGNKRIGLYVMLVLLEMNGIKLSFTQPELIELGQGLADGSIDSALLLDWIVGHRK